jgi:hypothetical protein
LPIQIQLLDIENIFKKSTPPIVRSFQITYDYKILLSMHIGTIFFFGNQKNLKKEVMFAL